MSRTVPHHDRGNFGAVNSALPPKLSGWRVEPRLVRVVEPGYSGLDASEAAEVRDRYHEDTGKT
jgi:hypothetical protein